VNENLTNDQMDMSMVGVEIKFMGLENAQSDYSSMEVGPVLQLIVEFKIGINSSIKIPYRPIKASRSKDFQKTMPLNKTV
jgi:hypothetical protein